MNGAAESPAMPASAVRRLILTKSSLKSRDRRPL
jgi:hypothetical protein